MDKSTRLAAIIIVFSFLVILPACQTLPPPASETVYIAPALAYLRACPSYDCPVLAEAYRTEAVDVQEKPPGDWWRVRSARTAVDGWIQSQLLSREPVPVQTYRAAPDRLPLRETPAPEAPIRRYLAPGEPLSKLDDNSQGWWLVMADTDKSVGWVPATQITARPPAPSPGPSDTAAAPGYVAVASLELHHLPLLSSPVVKTLTLNDRVLKLDTSGTSWMKVRHLPSGAEGWTLSRFVASAPTPAKRPAAPKKKKPRKRPAPPQPAETTPLTPETAPPPEVM